VSADPTPRPRYVLATDETVFEDRTARALRRGLSVARTPGAAHRGVVYVGAVGDLAGAADAVLAALAGAELVLWCRDDDVLDVLAEDLGRLGTVEHATAPSLVLPVDQMALLRHLQRGLSLGEAARAEHLSRRTADRRVAQARAGLGVRTTTEALVAAVRLGLLDPVDET
jgi:hypothetical protein